MAHAKVQLTQPSNHFLLASNKHKAGKLFPLCGRRSPFENLSIWYAQVRNSWQIIVLFLMGWTTGYLFEKRREKARKKNK